MRLRLRSDHGAATTEFVVVTPVLIAFLCLVMLTGRMTDARSDVIGAANDAARVASLQETAADATREARAAATSAVEDERLNCTGGGPDVTTSFLPNGFARGSTVQVTVSCTVNTSDLAFIGVPGSVTIEEQAWEPIDAHRSL